VEVRKLRSLYPPHSRAILVPGVAFNPEAFTPLPTGQQGNFGRSAGFWSNGKLMSRFGGFTSSTLFLQRERPPQGGLLLTSLTSAYWQPANTSVGTGTVVPATGVSAADFSSLGEQFSVPPEAGTDAIASTVYDARSVLWVSVMLPVE